MMFKQPQMNRIGVAMAVLGLIFVMIGLFGTAQCRQPFRVSGETEEQCKALLVFDPFEAGQDATWELWVFRNYQAVQIIGALIGALIALAANDRVAMLIGSLGFAAVVVMAYLRLSIGISDSVWTSMEWAWVALFVSIICLMISAFPANAPNTTDIEAVSTSPDLPSAQPQASVDLPAQTSSSLPTAYALVVVGLLILAFGGTYAPIVCNDSPNFKQDCGIGGDTAYFHKEAFDDGFEIGVQANNISFTILLMVGIGVLASFIKRPLGVAVAGWSALGFVAAIFLVYLALYSAGDDSIFGHIRWGWIGLFGGPLLLMVAANQFKRADAATTQT
jgi:uncharacterized membrane protein